MKFKGANSNWVKWTRGFWCRLKLYFIKEKKVDPTLSCHLQID